MVVGVWACWCAGFCVSGYASRETVLANVLIINVEVASLVVRRSRTGDIIGKIIDNKEDSIITSVGVAVAGKVECEKG